MKNSLKSHTLIMIIALFLAAFLSFHALERSGCFQISIIKQIRIISGFCDIKN